MDNKALANTLAKKLDIEAEDAARLIRDFVGVFTESCTELDSINIPRFGSFVTSKEDERIDIDLSTGARILLPPEIAVKFTAGSALRKLVGKGGTQ